MAASGEDITLRFYRQGDEQHILGLRDELSEIRATDKGHVSHWRHEMKLNPAGRAIIPMAFDDEGTLVSHLVMQPRRIRAFGADGLAYQVIDVMTHPRFRGRGMLTRINGMAMEEAAERGCDFFCGFPNRNSYPPYVKRYGWRLITFPPLLVKPLAIAGRLAPRPLRRLRTAVTGAAAAFVDGGPSIPEPEEISWFDEGFERLFARIEDEHPVMFRRDAETLNWRYVGVPHRRYRRFAIRDGGETVGFVVHRVARQRGLSICVVMDLFCTRGTRAMEALLRSSLRRMVAEEGVQLAFAMFLPHCRQHRAARDAGFFSLPPRLSPYKIAKVGKSASGWVASEESGLYRPENWYVSFGDNDVF
jgi:hypothetical protein